MSSRLKVAMVVLAGLLLASAGCGDSSKESARVADLERELAALKAQASATAATPTMTPAAPIAATPSATSTPAPAPVQIFQSAPTPAPAAPAAQPTAANALTVVSRRRAVPTPGSIIGWDVIAYYCVTYSVAGVGAEKCVQTYDYNNFTAQQANVVRASANERAAYDSLVSCWSGSNPGQPLADCWPR